jgi:hypothetical protein
LRVTLLHGCMLRQNLDFSHPYGLDFLDGFTGSAFFGGDGLRMRSTFHVRITCGWRGLSIDTILPQQVRKNPTRLEMLYLESSAFEPARFFVLV